MINVQGERVPKVPTGKIGKDGRIPLTIRLSPEVWQRLEEKSRQERTPKNVLVEKMLDHFIDRVKAQKAHDTERAIKYLPRMTYREYAKWTVGEAKLIEQEAARRQAGERTKVDGFGIRYEGEIVVSARVVEKICAEGKIPFVVGVLDEAEKQAIHKMLSKRREREAKKNAGQ